VTDAGLATLEGMPRLDNLRLDPRALSDRGLAVLGSLPDLKTLELHQGPIRPALLAPLAGIRGRWQFLLYDLALDDELIDVAATLPTLTALLCRGASPAVTDRGLARLAEAPALDAFWLYYASATGSGFEAWASSSRLVSFEAFGWPDLRDAGVAHLGTVSTLVAVLVPRCKRLTDAALDTLARLPRLEWINLEGCGRITDAGLLKLAGLPALKTLGVGTSKTARKITRAGIAAFEAAHGTARCYRH
jgi:hypothetical protein